MINYGKVVKIRLWSFHPKYLDNVGLSRAINESISGWKSLSNKQKMWQNHSQLTRFKESETKCANFRIYTKVLLKEKHNRWNNELDLNIEFPRLILLSNRMTVTEGQLKYEWQHYLNKLKTQKGRDKELYEKIKYIELPEPHPLFEVVPGEIESWEKVK